MTYRLSTDKTWTATLDDLAETFRKWRVARWVIEPTRPPRIHYGVVDRRVQVRWTRNGVDFTLTMDRQRLPEDNLRVLYLAIEALRLNDARGIADLLQQAYAQLPPPKSVPRSADDDPYSVLGVARGASRPVIDAAYRAQAKIHHPDTGGTHDGMKRITTAYEAVIAEMGRRQP